MKVDMPLNKEIKPNQTKPREARSIAIKLSVLTKMTIEHVCFSKSFEKLTI